tara:strand:- start:1068 stop:1364 length:297 start_codon:yes stop_codon:yes gene_type:complete
MTNLLFSVGGNGGAAVSVPAKNFLGVDLSDADTMQVSFLEEDGTLDAVIVALTFTGTAKAAAEALANAMAKDTRGLITVADGVNSKFLHPFTAIESIN